MKLIVGLGNPGPKYANTRHNIGFSIIDMIAADAGLETYKQRFQGMISQVDILKTRCLLFKPLTFMNLSGKAVAQVANFFKISPEDLILIYDDVDLEWGTVKLRMGGGSGGHNGVNSVITCVGSRDMPRIKVGVGRPANQSFDVAGWVLENLSEEEKQDLSSDVFFKVKERLLGILA